MKVPSAGRLAVGQSWFWENDFRESYAVSHVGVLATVITLVLRYQSQGQDLEGTVIWITKLHQDLVCFLDFQRLGIQRLIVHHFSISGSHCP